MTNHPSGVELSGVFVPATSPFDPESGRLDLGSLEQNLQAILRADVSGVVIGGTTGEAVLLTRAERTSSVETASGLLRKDQLLIAGTGAESTLETLRLTLEAASAGAHAVLVQPPAYYQRAMDAAHLAEHYRAVADEAPVPVVVYQPPLTCSTIDLPTHLVAELSQHPDIIGIKDSRGDLNLLGEILTRVSDGFQVLVGNGAKLYAALEMGASGGILGVANLVPAEASAIFRSFSEGRTAEAGRLQESVGALHNGIVAAHGVPGIKAALEIVGLMGGVPRAPLRPAAETTIESVKEALRNAGFLDTPAVPA